MVNSTENIKIYHKIIKIILFIFVCVNLLWLLDFSNESYQIKKFRASINSTYYYWNQKIKDSSRNYTLLNIFSHNNTVHSFENHKKYKIYFTNITSDVIFFMNTSKNYSTLNVNFDVLNLSITDIICTYCTLQKFIRNKYLHFISFVNLPMEVKFIAKNYFLLQKCSDTIITLNKQKCPLYYDTEGKMSIKSKIDTRKKSSTLLIKPFNVNLDCKQLIMGNEMYIKKASKKRIVVTNKDLPMDCSSIYKRGFNVKESLTEIEKKYSIAFASNIYKNYEVIELKLLSIYSPNNHYCYMIDLKNPDLYKQMIALEKCLPNVYVPKVQYDVKSNGENTSISHYECMKTLVKTNFDYVFLLQNDEMPLKTNKELIEILEAMNFAMDMRIALDEPVIQGRVDYKKPWKFKDLNIFLKGDVRRNNVSIMNKKIEFTNGLITTGLPRDSVDYLVNKLNITTFLNQLNTNIFGNDELTWQTLLTSEILKVPGYVPRKYALNYFLRPYYLSKFIAWGGEYCPTGTFHHAICSWGVESLKYLKNSKYYFLYRFREDFDYGAMICYGEYLYNKTHFEEYERPDLWFYYNSPLSIYKRLSLTNNMELIKNYKQWL